MSRNSSGTYTLPAGNPVVTGTTITSTWGNTTMSDIANALTDSLSRSGLGSMTAGLRLFDGTSSLPGLTWGTELTSGLYRAGTGDFRWVIATVEIFSITTAGISGSTWTSSGTTPSFTWIETDASANNRRWDIIASGEQFLFRALTDALVATNWLVVDRTAGAIDSVTSASPWVLTKDLTAGVAPLEFASGTPGYYFNETDAAADNRIWAFQASSAGTLTYQALNDARNAGSNWLLVDRTGTTIDTVNFPSGTLQYAGIEVGYRDLPTISSTGNRTFLNTDRGRMVEYSGAGGHTQTVPTAGTIADGGLITLLNVGTGTTAVAVTSGSLVWFNGSGALSTGTRTLAIGAVVTLRVFSSGSTYIWGTGIS